MHVGVFASAQAPTLRELEDVLLAVKDAEGSIGQDFSDVSGVEPSVALQNFRRLVILLVVPSEDGAAAYTDLSSGRTAQGVVVHLGDGLQPEVNHGQRGPDCAQHALQRRVTELRYHRETRVGYHLYGFESRHTVKR